MIILWDTQVQFIFFSNKSAIFLNSFMTEVRVSYRNQPSIDLLCKLMSWFLYDRDLRHETEIKKVPRKTMIKEV